MLYGFDELSFQVLTVGRFFHKKGVFEVKERPFSVFSLRTRGTVRFEVDQKVLNSHEGEILFLPANMGYRAEYETPGESIVVHFLDCNYTNAENFVLKNPKKAEALFQRLLTDWEERGAVNRVKSGVYEILDQIAADQRLATLTPAFAQCVRYLEEHAFDPKLRIEDACNAGFMSTSGMYRSFYACFGMSAKSYLNKLRMSRALTLLSQDDCSILEIAEACGFNDVKYFSKAFKATYGCPPSHFKHNITV